MPSSLDDYEVLGTIGSGSYGTCRKIRRKKDGKTLVWKEMDYGTMTENEKQMLVSEVNLLRELKHQHIVRYYDRIIDRSNSTLYIVMEFCEGGDVASIINKMKREGTFVEEGFVWRICYQAILALKECHCRTRNGKAVLHRDLKPANVFLDANSNVKLGDFGLARVLNHDTSFAKTFVGTPYYMSPEQMTYNSYNEKSDVWSLGCMLYELAALRPPFTAANQKELATRICVGRFSRLPNRYSDDLNAIIGAMIQVDEKQRPSIGELLENPLFSKHAIHFERRTSSQSSDESGYDSRKDSIKRQEEALKGREDAVKLKEDGLRAREKALQVKEKELDSKEQNLILREKVSAERLSRAERLMKELAQLRQRGNEVSPLNTVMSSVTSTSSGTTTNNTNLNHAELSTDGKQLTSILSKVAMKVPIKETTPKKHVTFHATGHTEKENNNEWVDLPRDHYRDVENQIEAEHARHMLDLRTRLRKAKMRADELRRTEIESRLHNIQLLGIR